jgi:hypothetical protein
VHIQLIFAAGRDEMFGGRREHTTQHAFHRHGMLAQAVRREIVAPARPMPAVEGNFPGVVVSFDLDAELVEDDAAIGFCRVPLRLLDLADHAGVHYILLTGFWADARAEFWGNKSTRRKARLVLDDCKQDVNPIGAGSESIHGKSISSIPLLVYDDSRKKSMMAKSSNIASAVDFDGAGVALTKNVILDISKSAGWLVVQRGLCEDQDIRSRRND